MSLPHIAPRRRNGKQQACEPCRRRKVACDHQLPVCSRCRRGGVSTTCVYLVQDRALVVAPSSPSLPPAAPSTAVIPITAPSPQTDGSTPRSETQIGYLGATSFSAFFEDPAGPLPSGRETGTPGPQRTLDDKTYGLAVDVLRSIPDERASRFLFKRHVNPNDGWCRLAAQRLLDSLWTTFRPVLDSSRSQHSLTQMALSLLRNGSLPLREDQTDPDEWLGAFSDSNWRWESLGILFTYWCFGAMSLPSNAGQDDFKELGAFEKKQLVLGYKASAWKCIELSRDVCNGNTLLAYLVYRHFLLESNISGDAGMQPWRLHGDLVALITYLGLHIIPPFSTSGPSTQDWSIASQMKHRVFAAVYNIDKVAATFTGRPPLMGHRYSSTPLPLDINDERLLSGPPSPHLQDYKLDDNGWNTDGKIYSTTILRARTMLSFIREGILEIALQVSGFPNTEALLDLRRRAMDTMSQFPSIIVYHAEDAKSPSVDGPTLYTKLLVYLEHLQNLFFIERLLNKTTFSDTGTRLFDVSLEMVTLTMVFWTRQNRLQGMHADFQWLVMSYAAPAAGILCMELLKPPSVIRAGDTTSTARRRSVILQQLGLLLGFLEWIGPEASNSGICSNVHKAVSHVLEQAMNPAPATSADPAAEMADWSAGMQMDMNELFNFELLDTFEWLRPVVADVRVEQMTGSTALG